MDATTHPSPPPSSPHGHCCGLDGHHLVQSELVKKKGLQAVTVLRQVARSAVTTQERKLRAPS
jgi:hypothetical protein